jgi:hypothetical protein
MSGQPYSRAPAHQNKVAFRHNPKSRKTALIASIPASVGCCRHCVDVIEWKRNYRCVEKKSACARRRGAEARGPHTHAVRARGRVPASDSPP